MLWGRRQLELDDFDVRVLHALVSCGGRHVSASALAEQLAGPHTTHVRRSLRKLRVYFFVERDERGDCRATEQGVAYAQQEEQIMRVRERKKGMVEDETAPGWL